MSTSDINNDQCGGSSGEMKSTINKVCSCEQTDVNNITEGIDSVTILNDISTCAACGKEGNSDDMNTCNKCKMVKYCNAVCKKVHKKKHKKDCEEHQRQVAELHDEKLFKLPPPKEDCPICFIQLPSINTGWRFQSCCGKVICSGCVHAPVYDNQGNEVDNKLCPFCRDPLPGSDEEAVERTKKLMNAEDPIAIHNTGCDYRDGTCGFPRDHTRALELFHRAAELGHAKAYGAIGYAYDVGRGAEIDKKKAMHYYELSAMGGNAAARHNLGNVEKSSGNFDRALKHYMIAIEGGSSQTLEYIKSLYLNGQATKEDYSKALQSYQDYIGKIKSRQRDQAAAYDDLYRYH